MWRQRKTDVAFPDHAAPAAAAIRIRMTCTNILTAVNMELEAIKKDLDSVINQGKLETA